MRFRWTKPPTVPTDTIVPLHSWDDVSYNREICVDVITRFDDVLDAEKLRRSLQRLLEIGEWRKLGARLRLNDAGKLEYHIPARYDATRPGFTFTTAEHDMKILDHPVAVKLPRGTHVPTVLGSTTDLASLVLTPDTPRQLSDWIDADRPQLAVHVVTFHDATIVTVSWLHTLMDAMGHVGFLKAWTAVLRGREDEVPPFHGFANDPLATVAQSTPPERFVHHHRVLKGFGMLVFVLRLLWELLWYPRVEERIVCVPGRFVTEMRATAMQELADDKADDDKEEAAPFLSESDVLLSWWTRTMLTALRPSRNRTVLFMNVFNVRPIVPECFPAGTVYVGNAVMAIHTHLRVREILDRPVSFLAQEIRRSLAVQRTKEQIEALAAVQQRAIDATGRPPLVGPSDSLLVVCSNWHQAKYFEWDLAPAVVTPGIPLAERAQGLGKPSLVLCGGHQTGLRMRNVGPVMGKDATGNWWMSWTMRRGAWVEIQRQLEMGHRKTE